MKNEDWIAFLILKYLLRKPLAKDTLSGISEWWIMQERVNYTVEKVNNILDFWVSKGFINVTSHHGQENLYEINKDKIAEIESALEDISENLDAKDVFTI